MATDHKAARERMVAEQLASRGISDERVLAAMAAVPRERFVPEELADHAYDDCALAIGQGQTISQPWIVAAICQALELEGGETVFEVGTGSGYSTAILARIARRVISVERIPELVAEAEARLAALGVDGVEVISGDGSAGDATLGPFEAIAVHAAVPAPPRSLLAQLAPGGRLVAPIVDRGGEHLTQIRRGDDEGVPSFETRRIAACRFVPLIGTEGFSDR